MERPYPAHWEADVVLRDGGTAHLRPIRPDDEDRLQEFHVRQSPESIYFRFFAPYPRLTERDLYRFTHVDHDDRVALVATIGDEIIGVVRYDRVDPGEYGEAGTGADLAEVAFNISDAHQGRGLGSVFLEHIAAAARERGITRFVADILPNNRKMIGVFRDAGYQPVSTYEEGLVRLTFDLMPTETSLQVQQEREHRAEARSIARLLAPRSVAVVGASRTAGKLGRRVLRNLVEAEFTGALYAVNPGADEVAGVKAYASLLDVPDPVDLVVVAVPADAVEDVVVQSARKGVRGLVVISAGFAETGEEGRARQVELVRTARANGMRVIGPNCLGVINTDPALSLNASLSPVVPAPGAVGFFCQSGALGIALLDTVVERGMGLSTFVSAGNRADVSGNDLLQFWEDDPLTDVVLLYLESIGNPRKFARLSRRVSRRKPVVAVKAGGSTQGVPLGHAVAASSVPPAAVEAMFRQSGVIRVDTSAQLIDVARVLASQPLPGGRRVAVVGNAYALEVLAVDACAACGLEVAGGPVSLDRESSATELAAALDAALDDPAVDALVAVFVPALGTTDEEVADVLSRAAARAAKPVVASVLALDRAPSPALATFASPEEAVRALASVVGYAEWRRRPPGKLPPLEVDTAAARAVVTSALAAGPGVLPDAALREVLAAYGVDLWPSVPASSEDEAVAAAETLGYPVVLKTLAPHLRHRTDLGGVRLDLGTERAVRRAYGEMCRLLGTAALESCVVQRMAPNGVAVVVETMEDPLFGPVVSFGLGGVATELLGDRAYRIPPLTDVEVAELVREVRAAPLLFGYRGAAPGDVAALERLLLRVSRLADDLPEVAHLELNPVVVAASGLSVVGAQAHVAPPVGRRDVGPRRLGGAG